MKPRSFLSPSTFPAIVAVCIMVGSQAQGAPLYWDGGISNITTGGGNGVSAGGSGTWSTTIQNWDSGASTHVVWSSGNDAVFGGTAGTVTVSGTVNATGITFNTSGYTVTAPTTTPISNTLNLAPTSGAFVFTTNGGTNTIDGTVSSAAGTSITKTGAGTLQLNATVGGGTSASPHLYTVTGGTLNAATGVFSSILAMPAGNRLGALASTPTTVLTLDAGTFQITSATGNALAAQRRVQVNAAGGSIVDFGSNNFFEAPIINNAGASSSLYLSNGSGASQFRGVISGTGSVTWNGAGVASLQGANTYSGGTFINGGALSVGELVGNSTLEGSNTGLGSGSVNVASAAQLVIAGNNLSVANNITLNGAATVAGRQGALVGGFQDGNSANTLSGTLTLAGTGDRTISTWWSDKTLALTGKVTGTGTLRVVNVSSTASNGGSIVSLSNTTNDYSGGTIVDGGGNSSTQTLRLANNNVIPDGAGKGNVTINGRLETNGFTETINGLTGSGVISAGAGSNLFVGNNDATSDFSGSFAGTSTSILRKIGSGTITLSGTSDNVGGRARVDAGTLLLAKTSNADVHAVGSAGGADLALQITGGTARLGGTGGDQIYSNSAVTMSGGTFDLAGLSEGFDGLSGNGGTITNSVSSTTSTLTLGQNNSSGTQNFGGIIQNGAGTLALTKTGTGTQTLSGANTYSGGTSLTGGTLAVANNNGLGTGTLTMGAGTTLGNYNTVAHTLANNIAFGSTATLWAGSDLTLNGALSGGTSGTQISVQGPGTVTVSNNAHNLGSGATPAVWTISNGGTLALTQGNNLGNLPATATSQVVLSSGTFKTISPNATFLAERGIQVNAAGGTWHDSAGGVSINGAVANQGQFTVNTSQSNATSSLKGAISGSGSLIKSGGGTLALDASNTYTGATSVTGGKLVVNGSISTSVTTTISSSATLGGSGTVGSLVVQSGGTLAPGNSPGILNTGTIDLRSGSTFSVEINGVNAGTGYDVLNVTGSATLAGLLDVSLGFVPTNGDMFFILQNDSNDAVNGAFSGLVDNSGFTIGNQQFKISYFGDSQTSSFTGGNDVVLMAIPEPGAALLGSLGLLSLLHRRRRPLN